MITRVPPGTWETLPLPSSKAAGDTAYQLQIDPRLRVLEAGHPIAIGIVDEPSIGIDTPEDYRRFVDRFRKSQGGG